ncbi:glycoside hydrolase family 76 [Corynebacterium sp. TAE3-ERU12]|uniref:glycoside hydrolase family 76 protein n=1 Tax=Corynebacterium sp. TAE3-ERU12 TaxID=2849491 RepID=UPI001C4425AC|nr:glycoside hydrolase family 76 protein [Corynebacterium sp. TAE3-ERU12]MBV7295994.1 glycoside hydrolase family 76 [Corynebacterium sp. TAE3-ERU12]
MAALNDPTRAGAENWAYRADMAEQGIRERHASTLWSIPRTNLAVVSWPAPTQHKLFFSWHYWWQAHYLDCLIDAYLRLPSKAKARAVQDTIRGMRIRNLQQFTANRYYDDRAWLQLALCRADRELGRGSPRRRATALLSSLSDGIDPDMGVLPWRVGDLFFNVPANGPAAIAFARHGRIDEARSLVDWVFDNLINENGLVMDGVRLVVGDQDIQRNVYTYNQGVMIGACLEIAKGLRERGDRDRATRYLTRVYNLVHAVVMHQATANNVIKGGGGGDGGLFNGILIRYLAQAAIELPDDDRMSRATRRICRRIVLSTAESAWQRRLEVDGLPLFPADWTDDATFPQSGGLVSANVGGTTRGSSVRERDLSVQLSGWMLMEAAAAVAAHQVEDDTV